MKKIEKIELFTLIFVIITYFLLNIGKIPSLVYLSLTLLVSIYFFPIRLFVNFKEIKDKLGVTIVSSFLISALICLSYVSYSIGELGMVFKFFILSFTVINIYLIYHFSSKKDTTYYLHLLITLLIPMILYKIV